jgi:hypothetical protein
MTATLVHRTPQDDGRTAGGGRAVYGSPHENNPSENVPGLENNVELFGIQLEVQDDDQ